MKQCPTCDRTYADNTLSFCLVDGAILSAAYDAQATEQFSPARRTDQPPTEILPGAPGTAPTQPAQDFWPASPTIQSPVSPNAARAARQDNFRTGPAKPKTSRLPWLIGSLVALAAIGIIFVIGYNMGSERAERSGGNSNGASSGPGSTPAASTDSSPASNTQMTQPDSAPMSSNVNQSNTGIGSGDGSMANGNTSSAPGMRDGGPVDYGKVFTPNEVDQKAQILSKPAPVYTEAARQNQITGMVVLKVTLSSSGTVTDVQAISGLPYGLTEKAIAAAKQIQFTPATKDGRAVSQALRVEYNFSLY